MNSAQQTTPETINEMAFSAYDNECLALVAEDNQSWLALRAAYVNASVYQPELVSQLRLAILDLAESMGFYRATISS